MEIMVKEHEEHRKSIKEKIDLTSFDLSKVAKSEVMSWICTLRIPSYLDTMNKMKLDKDIWKNHLLSIKTPNIVVMTEFMNAFRTWKLARGQGDTEDVGDAEDKEEEETT